MNLARELPTNPNFLTFNHPVPLNTQSLLYVRASYREIATAAVLKPNVEERRYVVITGTPGVGKSVFLYYIFWHLMEHQQRVLFLTKEPSIYFDGNAMSQCSLLPSSGNHDFWNSNLWVLVDSRDPTIIPGIPIDYCSVILVTTPRNDFIGEFKKLIPTPPVFYMPLWSRAELQTIAPQYPLSIDWVHRFEVLGGVPRLVLQIIDSPPETVLLNACAECSVEQCINAVNIDSEVTNKTKIAQTLIHIQSVSPFTAKTNQYASDVALRTIARNKWTTDRIKMQSLLSSCSANTLAGSLCGYIFEPFAIEKLEAGGRFTCRELVTGNIQNREEPITIPVSIKPHLIVENVVAGQAKKLLHLPLTPNYPGIDAWIPGTGGFQMTVGKLHSINRRVPVDLALLGRGGNKLYFVVPPLHFDTFSRQTALRSSFKQYALLMPYPDVI